jgi:hypothetical protein
MHEASPTERVPRSAVAGVAEALLVFLAAACLYLPFLSRHFDENGVAEAVSLDSGNLFSANHLLYLPLGLLASDLVRYAGFAVRSILTLQVISALGGAVGIALAYLFFRELTRDRFAAVTAALWLATTWAYWIVSTDAMYFPVAAMFVAGALAVFLGQTRPAAIVSGALLGFAVTTWQANVLLVPVFLAGLFLLKQGPFQARLRLAGHFLWACLLPICSLYPLAANAAHFDTPQKFVRWITSHGGGVELPMWGQFAVERLPIAGRTAVSSIVPLGIGASLWLIVGVLALASFVLVRVCRRTSLWMAGAYVVLLIFIVWWEPWQPKWFVVPNIFLAGLLAQLLHQFNLHRYAKCAVAGALAASAIANFRGTVWERHSRPNPNFEVARCVASHMQAQDVVLATEWGWSGYLRYFFFRRQISVIDWGASLRDRDATLQALWHLVVDRQRSGGNAYILDGASYSEAHVAWLESELSLRSKDLAEFQGPIAFECLGKTFRRVPATETPEPSYIRSDRFRLSTSVKEVQLGQQYSLAVSGGSRKQVLLRYQLNGGPVDQFVAQLDEQGRASFDVGAATRTGLYRFVGFQLAGHSEWIAADAALLVR